MGVCDGLGKQTTMQVINKTTTVKRNQKSSSGVENDIGDRGGQSLLATASRREKGGRAGVEGVRLSGDLNDSRDGCKKQDEKRIK
jgi:hypothetical protein